MKSVFISVILTSLLLAGCKSSYHYTQPAATLTPVHQDSLQLFDSSTYYLIAPYKLKLEAQMNEVIGRTTTRLTREKPECTLGNLVSDATFWYASAHFDKPIDACIMNYGGIRIPSMEAGNIKVSDIYELMPFDNMVEILTIRGRVLNDFLQLVAAAGGWPVTGITMEIENRKAVNILVRGKPLDPNQAYTIVTSDYVANGGDRAEMLRQFDKRSSLNCQVRDAIITYVQYKGTLTITTNGRITTKP